MSRKRSQRPGGQPIAPKPARSFRPQITTLEDRTVPSTFYVDPAFAGSKNLASVNFNVGYSGSVNGVLFATDAAAYNAAKAANPDASFGFDSLYQAILASELNAGPDVIRIARSTTPIPLDNSNFIPVPGAAPATFNSIIITQPLSLIGSGTGATVIAPTNDTQLDPDGAGAQPTAPNAGVAVVRIGSTANPNANVTVSDLTFDGTGKQLGTAFQVRDSATALFDRVQVEGVQFPAGGAVAVVGINATLLTVQNSEISGYDRAGISFQNTTGKVFNTKVTGPGGPAATNGIEVVDNSTVTVSGSVLTGNTGPAGSNGILVSGGAGTAPVLTAFGNLITGNLFGVTVGSAAGDTAQATLTRNNIYGNNVGIDATFAAKAVDASQTFWNSPLGPATSTTADFTQPLGNPVTKNVTVGTPLTVLNPVIDRPTLAAYTSILNIAAVPATPAQQNEAATIWVDPTFTGAFPFTFNKGYPGEQTLTAAQAGQVFSDLAQAISKANADPGKDVIRIAQSGTPIAVNNATFNVPAGSAGVATINAIQITAPLDIIGSGTGATILAPTNNSQVDLDGPAGPGLPADNAGVSLFRVAGAGIVFNVFDLTLDGTGKQLGAGFQVRDGATGAFDRVQVEGVRFAGDGAVGILGLNAGGLTVNNSEVSGYDRTGIQFLSTNGSVVDSRISGPGGAAAANVKASNGIEVLDNSTVTVTGSTLTGNTGTGGSNGILVSGTTTPATAPSLTAFGNWITGNAFGLTFGAAAGENTKGTVAWNNIAGNETAIDAKNSANAIAAGKNYFGGNVSPTTGVSGPSLGPGTAGTTSTQLLGNPITANVNLGTTPVFLAGPTPVFGRATLGGATGYLAAINTVTATVTPVNATVTSGPVQFTVTFNTPVRPQAFGPDGFTAADLVVRDANNNVVPASQITITPVGAEPAAQYLVTVNGLSGFGSVSATVNVGTGGPPDPVVFSPEGFRGPTTATSASVAFGTSPPVTPPVTPPPPANLVGSKQFAVGADGGGAALVRMFNPDNTERFSLNAFPGFTGGVRVATADFTGDGVADLVVGTGPGITTQVRVLDGVTQAELFRITPFEATFTGGVFVAAGDVTGDGIADLVITPDVTGGPRARIFNGKGFGQIADFFGIEDPNFRGGARVAVGDMNGDGVGDLLFAAGFSGGPRVAGFNGIGLGDAATRKKLFADFFVFEQTLRNGVFPAAGDINGDGFADVVAGAGPAGGPRVFALSGRDLSQDNTQVQLANFFGGDVPNRGGIRVAVKDLDGDNKADILTGPGTSVPTPATPVAQGFGTRVTQYAGKTIPVDGTPPELARFDAFPGFAGGVFVG